MTRSLKALAVLTLLAAAPAALAQAQSYSPIRVDTTFFVGYAPADANAYGFGVAIEPKFNVTDQLAAGLRLEGSGFVTQEVRVGAATNQAKVSQGARAVTAVSAKGDYYLTTSWARPFVGLGLGFYRIGAASQSVSTEAGSASVVQSAAAFKGFGAAPQVGLNLGSFRVAATYHAIFGGDMVMVTQAVGAEPVKTKLAKNFVAFEIGGTFGGGRRD